MLIRNVYISCFVKVKTMCAQVELFNKMIDSKSLILRNEKILKNDSKFLKIVCDDKSKIAVGQTIAEIYGSDDEVNFSNTLCSGRSFNIEDINSKVNNSIRDFIHNEKINNNLDFLVKSKDLFLNGKLNLSSSNENNTKQHSELKSDCNGFFSCFTDGFEENLNLDIKDEDIKSINFSNYETIKNDNATFGKIITDNKCLILCLIDKNVEIKNKKNKIYFQLNENELICDLVKIIDINNDKKIAIFSCNINDFLINARVENVKISLESAEGIKIYKNCLREQDGKIGVFVLDRKVVKFKPIDINYDNDDFVLCNCGENAEELNQNDLIIISGSNLYDGKILMF